MAPTHSQRPGKNGNSEHCSWTTNTEGLTTFKAKCAKDVPLGLSLTRLATSHSGVTWRSLIRIRHALPMCRRQPHSPRQPTHSLWNSTEHATLVEIHKAVLLWLWTTRPHRAQLSLSKGTKDSRSRGSSCSKGD